VSIAKALRCACSSKNVEARSSRQTNIQAVSELTAQRLRVVLAIALTLAVLHLVPNRLLVLIPLFLCWAVLFYPVDRGELALFVVAGLFITVQNYLALRDGIFEFRFKDILLMPYYEPLLWGFYFVTMKRFIHGRQDEPLSIGVKAIAGLLATSAAFGLFSSSSRMLFAATLCSTSILFVLFHSKLDVSFALYALTLGIVVEIFGVFTGLWWYPEPDVIGIPYWFATMWLSVGLLGRRFAIPAARWLAGRF
jgi:hypothetical protein